MNCRKSSFALSAAGDGELGKAGMAVADVALFVSVKNERELSLFEVMASMIQNQFPVAQDEQRLITCVDSVQGYNKRDPFHLWALSTLLSFSSFGSLTS